MTNSKRRRKSKYLALVVTRVAGTSSFPPLAIPSAPNGLLELIFESVTKDKASYILDFLDITTNEVYQRNTELKKSASKKPGILTRQKDQTSRL